MNTRILYLKDKQLTSSGIKKLPGKKKERKILVFALTVKKQKLGINKLKRFVLNVTKAHMVLA